MERKKKNGNLDDAKETREVCRGIIFRYNGKEQTMSSNMEIYFMGERLGAIGIFI